MKSPNYSIKKNGFDSIKIYRSSLFVENNYVPLFPMKYWALVLLKWSRFYFPISIAFYNHVRSLYKQSTAMYAL